MGYNYREHEIQKACVRYFRLAYPQYAYVLFSVPNGAQRTTAQARIAKEEGMVAGVSDLLLLVPRNGYGCLCIEMKKKGGYQEPEQKVWQQEAEKAGNKYVVIRSFDEFKTIVEDYLGESDGTSVSDARSQLANLLKHKK